MKKRSLWSRVLTMLLVVCLLMTDQSTSLFMEAVSAAAWQPEEEETFQSGNGETSEEIQEGGEEQEQITAGKSRTKSRIRYSRQVNSSRLGIRWGKSRHQLSKMKI